MACKGDTKNWAILTLTQLSCTKSTGGQKEAHYWRLEDTPGLNQYHIIGKYKLPPCQNYIKNQSQKSIIEATQINAKSQYKELLKGQTHMYDQWQASSSDHKCLNRPSHIITK